MQNTIIDNKIHNTFIIKGITIYLKIVYLLECFALPLLVLFMRFWIGLIFLHSGLNKISNWPGTLYLFENEYKTPILSPELAAYCSTVFELGCPILLFWGFATRFAILPMLAMTAVIEFTYLHLIDHHYWTIILLFILCYGAGRFSIDYFIFKKFIPPK